MYEGDGSGKARFKETVVEKLLPKRTYKRRRQQIQDNLSSEDEKLLPDKDEGKATPPSQPAETGNVVDAIDKLKESLKSMEPKVDIPSSRMGRNRLTPGGCQGRKVAVRAGSAESSSGRP